MLDEKHERVYISYLRDRCRHFNKLSERGRLKHESDYIHEAKRCHNFYWIDGRRTCHFNRYILFTFDQLKPLEQLFLYYWWGSGGEHGKYTWRLALSDYVCVSRSSY